MQSILQFFKTTLLGGMLFLVPVMVLVLLIGKAFDLAHKVVDPLAEQIPAIIREASKMLGPIPE